MKQLLILSILLASSAFAFAGDTSETGCTQPTIPNPQASEVIVKLFNKRVDQYKKCLTNLIDKQEAIYKTSTDAAVANPAHDLAEKAIKEYNAFIEIIKERDARAGKEEDDDEDKK